MRSKPETIANVSIKEYCFSKKQINGSQIFNEISLRIQNFKSENINVVVEQVSAMPGQGVTSMFNFG